MTINGTYGNDNLVGTNGNDTFNGSAGNDHDVVFYNDGNSSTTGIGDYARITDFGFANDSFTGGSDLSIAFFNDLSPQSSTCFTFKSFVSIF